MGSTKHDDDHEQTRPRGERRPYTAPAVLESATFETLALACNKTSTEQVCAFLGMQTAS